MAYLNIDTKNGWFGLGTAPYKAKGAPEPGSTKVELWAEGIERVTGSKKVDDIRLSAWDEPLEFPEVNHVRSEAGVGGGARPFKDTLLFRPGTLSKFRVWDADPPVTVIKDGEVLAEDVTEWQNWMPMWQKVAISAGVVVVGAAVTKALDWW